MEYLVATDGSSESDAAVRHATRNAIAFDARLTIAHVLTPETELVDGRVVLPGEQTAIEEGKEVLGRARDHAQSVEAELETECKLADILLTGHPAQAIVDHVEEEDIDGIFVGHRGLSADRPRGVGSVAKNVLDKATVPVTIIR
jgi:nucleotide-binding universal stress UspA family protein